MNNSLLDSIRKRSIPGATPPAEEAVGIPDAESVDPAEDRKTTPPPPKISPSLKKLPNKLNPPQDYSALKIKPQGEMSSMDDLSDQMDDRAKETSGWDPGATEKVARSDRYDWTTVRETMMENWDSGKQGLSLVNEIWGVISFMTMAPGKMGPDEKWTANAGATMIGHILVELETKMEIALSGGKRADEIGIIPGPTDWVRGLARSHGRSIGFDYEDSETPMLDMVIEFYRQRYPFGDPDFDKALGLVLAHDLPGFLGDASMVISLMGGAARFGGKGASVMQRGLRSRMDAKLAKAGWQPSKVAMAWDKHLGGFAEGMEGVADFMNNAMKKPTLGSIPGMPHASNRLIDKWGRFQERWGLADMIDPGTMPIVAAVELLRNKQQRASAKHQATIKAQRKTIGASNMEMARADLPQIPDEAMVESYGAGGGIRGNPVRLIGSDPTHQLNQMDAEWAVFESDKLIFSNHPLSGQPNEVYPQQYQQRDRSTEESMQGVRHKAGTLAPELLIQQTASMTEGSPIMVAKRDPETGETRFYALGGNGRLMAINSADMQGLVGTENYRTYLKEHAAEFGIDPEQLGNMEKPILVRVIRSQLDEPQTVQATRMMNEGAPEQQRAREVATEDMKVITPGLLGAFNLTSDTSLERMLQAPSNRDMMTRFIGSLPRAERAALATEGVPNNQAVDRFINAFVARAYEGADPRIRRFLLESGEELKHIQNAALMMSPKIVEIKSRIENGLLSPEYDIGPDIGEALAFYVDVHNYQPAGRASTIVDYLDQPDLFDQVSVSGTGKLLAYFLEQNRNKPRVIRETLGKYFDEILKERDMFDTGVPPKKEILAEALEGKVENLDELLEDVSNLDEVNDTVEKAAESLENTNDGLIEDADIKKAGESNASALDKFTNENNQQWKAALDEEMARLISSGEMSKDTMVVLESFMKALSPEMRHEFVTRMTNLGARQEFLDHIKAVAEPKLNEAVKAYESALEAEPTNRHAHVGMYWANRELNNKQQAAEWAEKAVKVAPDDPYAHSAQGSARMEKSDYQGAVESFSRALAFQSNDSFALKGRALAYTYLDMLDKADVDMDRAADLDRMSSEFRGSEDVETGRTRFEEKIATEPSETDAKKAAGRAWGRFEKGEYYDAIARADYALDKEPGHPEAHNVRGWSNYRLKKYEDSFNDFENMLRSTSPDDRRGLEFGYNGRGYNNYRLAQALIRSGRKQEGLQKLLAAQDDLSRAEALKRGVDTTEGIENTNEIPELPYVRSTDETAIPPDEVDPTIPPNETPLDTPPQEGGETVEPPPTDTTPPDVMEDITTALRLLDESEQNIRIEMMDNQKVGIYEGLDTDGNPTEKRLAFDADTDDDTVTQAVRQAIDDERSRYQQQADGEDTESVISEDSPPVTPEDEMPDVATETPPDAPPDTAALERRIADLKQRSQEADEALTQMENATELGSTKEQRQTLEIVRNNAERWRRELEAAESELADSQRPADDGDGEGAPPPEDEAPEVALSEVVKFRDYVYDYLKTEIDRQGEVNNFVGDYIIAFETLMEDLTMGLIGKSPEWSDVAEVFQDARAMVVSKMQADFIDFIKQELGHDLGDIERFENVRDQLFEMMESPDDVARVFGELDEQDKMRAQAAFLQRYIDDWAEGDTGAAQNLMRMQEDGLLHAFLGSDIMEGMEVMDEIIRDYTESDSPNLGGRISHRRGLEDAQREQTAREAEAAEARRQLEESQAQETQDAEASESEQLDAEQSEMREESREAEGIQISASNIRQRKSRLEAKARQAEAAAEAAAIRTKLQKMRIQEGLETQARSEKESQARQVRREAMQAEIDRLEDIAQFQREPAGESRRPPFSIEESAQQADANAESILGGEGDAPPPQQTQRDMEEMQQTTGYQPGDIVEFGRTDPMMRKISAKREAEMERSNIVKTLARIGNSGGIGWTVGTFGLHLAVKGAARSLVWMADGWKVRKILKRYEPHFNGPNATKMIVEAFYEMMKEAKRQGTLKSLQMVNAPSKRPSLAPVRIGRVGERVMRSDDEENARKPNPRRNQRRGGLIYDPNQ